MSEGRRSVDRDQALESLVAGVQQLVGEMSRLNDTLARAFPPLDSLPVPAAPRCCDIPENRISGGFGSTEWMCRVCESTGGGGA